MSKIKVKVVSVGYLPADFDKESIEKIKSDLFQLTGEVESFSLNSDSDLEEWAYSDELLSSEVPNRESEDVLIVLTSVPLEDNYYTRSVDGNTVIFTFHEIVNYLRCENIPLENVIKRLIYAYILVLLRNNKIIPQSHEITNFTHDETRGCLFDMNGLKEDIVNSCHAPQICGDCTQRLLQEKVSNDVVKTSKSEIRKIKKPKYYRIIDWVKRNPVWSIIISSVWAVIIGVSSSLLASALS